MSPITVRTYRPGDEPAGRKGGAVLPSSNAVSEAARRECGRWPLAAIAAEAGVSLPTVSKVVNGRRDVAPATRALRERLLPEHQYTRAGTRRHRRSGLIDLVFNGLDSPWAVEILRGVEEWGTEHSPAVAVSAVRHGHPPAGVVEERGGEPRYRRGDPGDLRAHRQPAGAAPGGRHPAGRPRPGEPAASGPAQRRRHELGRRPGCHRAPAGLGTPPDRGDRRAG